MFNKNWYRSTTRYTEVVQEPFQVSGVSEIEIPIESITIDIGDLPQYNAHDGMNDNGGIPIDEDE